jgi:hypothetical protein
LSFHCHKLTKDDGIIQISQSAQQLDEQYPEVQTLIILAMDYMHNATKKFFISVTVGHFPSSEILSDRDQFLPSLYYTGHEYRSTPYRTRVSHAG